ncbi:MAG: PadR family transcriptional regulator [Oscillospiraceae bacterium]
MAFGLSAALLDACVLAVVSREDVYGYILTQNIKEVIEISESTLYPVLRRLQKDGCLTTYEKSFQGRNRRYYAITEFGREKLQFYLGEWNVYKDKVDKMLSGGYQHE